MSVSEHKKYTTTPETDINIEDPSYHNKPFLLFPQIFNMTVLCTIRYKHIKHVLINCRGCSYILGG